MLRINQMNFSLTYEINIKKAIATKLRIPESDVLDYKIHKESIDARKGKAKLVYTIDFNCNDEAKLLAAHKFLSVTPEKNYEYPTKGDIKLNARPIIVGFGPAGMFAALILAQMGYNPLILEQGEDVDARTKSVDEFWKSGKLNTRSNVQFGEGGAGTFSDGKLTARSKDLRCNKILQELVDNGAPDEILYKNKPHIGTDLLKGVVKTMRNRIIELGGEVRFSTKVDELVIENDIIKAVKLENGDVIKSEVIVLAIGHSSRDTFEELHKKGVSLTPKPFAMGMRIEHPQKMINKAQYKDYDIIQILGPADYHLTHTTEEGRAVYTFCMCPGGMVVASSSEEGGIVTNGMSHHARDHENSNSAILVSVTPDDYFKDHPLDGMYLQRKIENDAFKATNETYKAPYISVGEFMKGVNYKTEVKSTYTPGVETVSPYEYMPSFIVDSIKEAIPNFANRLNDFDMDGAILTGPETRSSSPVRINRDLELFESTNISGLYPCGEGAGYAGGIVSSGVDGVKIAEEIIKKYYL